MNPIIASSIVAQRQQDLLASAEHYRRIRRIRRATRTPRARRVSSTGEKLRVHRRFFKDVEAADAAAGSG